MSNHILVKSKGGEKGRGQGETQEKRKWESKSNNNEPARGVLMRGIELHLHGKEAITREREPNRTNCITGPPGREKKLTHMLFLACELRKSGRGR